MKPRPGNRRGTARCPRGVSADTGTPTAPAGLDPGPSHTGSGGLGSRHGGATRGTAAQECCPHADTPGEGLRRAGGREGDRDHRERPPSVAPSPAPGAGLTCSPRGERGPGCTRHAGGDPTNGLCPLRPDSGSLLPQLTTGPVTQTPAPSAQPSSLPRPKSFTFNPSNARTNLHESVTETPVTVHVFRVFLTATHGKKRIFTHSPVNRVHREITGSSYKKYSDNSENHWYFSSSSVFLS